MRQQEPFTDNLAKDIFRHSLIQGLLLFLAACVVGGAYLLPFRQSPKESAAGGIAEGHDSHDLTQQELKHRLSRADRHFQAENWMEAGLEYEAITEDFPGLGLAWHRLAYATHMQGKVDAAIPYHLKAAKFEKFQAVSLYNLGCAYSLKKDKQAALQYLRQAVEAGFGWLHYFDTDKDLDFLRQEAEFHQLRELVRQRNTQAATPAACPLSSDICCPAAPAAQ